MELVAILRLLWRRRLLVLLGAVLAAAVGVMLMSRSAPVEAAVATTGVVLDTPRSQLVDANPSGADTLAWRAGLLADLMATPPVVSSIARDLRIPARDLAVVNPSLAAPEIPASLPRNAAKAAAVARQQHVLVLQYDELLPIISIEATAPDRGRATRLAEAGTQALKSAATMRDTADVQGFVVDDVGSVHVREVGGGSGRMKVVALTVILLGAWCGAVALLPGLGRAWRAAGRPQPT
jgi:hypothetical protein